MIGIYYPYTEDNLELKNVFAYLNTRFKEMAKVYDIEYVDIFEIFSENPMYLDESNIFPSKEGLEFISSQIIVTINNSVLKSSWFYKKSLL